ncbi:tetratricopeptide repeat protein [Clavibacter michiganensis]|uniref:tetratricopeptide repeat protein n=1 Tax=Clavibacter michiganensis TaxID=28447 RepID=UPI0013030F5C|nr:tetratricopeptide repeat protein [Clavibacter michiganensis]KAF0258615.1 Tetratrico peptide repeat protein [Clavibacter michiganensis subsp. michiganensis]MDO4026599.1 tetratricopeptide repeat protein [Clavibacter michiganensis]MDO4035983.1 tetratricopeptide repeat protein [Clavibacter michiganensis]MDO4047587.1 tetratricopeptide repeat protein [Clavibacter michiganensis]MDO4106415.1 tetratricopeptide repeat protein [Clavibacter michiganensis]
MDHDDWDARVAAFWATADDERADETVAAMRALAAERPADDPRALFELACAHDFVGREAEAVPLYRAAIDGGLDPEHRPLAVIQLASSLRNVGEAEQAVALLEAMPDDAHAPGRDAFLALALHDAGRPTEALAVALRRLAATLPEYGRAVAAYADELTECGRTEPAED